MISDSAIMNKVNQFTNTSEGKKRIEKVIAKHRDSGKPLASGQRIVSVDEMKNLADILVETIRKHLPDSIRNIGDTLIGSQPIKRKDGSYEICIQFSKHALRRGSLFDDGYDGIENIVALLNNGYRASNYVYGYWDGHKSSGKAASELRNASGDNYAWIRSKKEREALQFMQKAIIEFNTIYGEKYNTTAELGSVYKE